MQSPPKKIGTLIIGAGVVGSSVAMHLAQAGEQGIRVVDLDLEGSLSSTELNAGGVRATWNQPLNILLAKRSIEYYATLGESVGYRPVGYLWLHRPETFQEARRAREVQTSLGWDVQVLNRAEIQRRYPFLDKLEDIEGAILGVRDGLVNPNLLKLHYRKQAADLGVVFQDRTAVLSSQVKGKEIDVELVTVPELDRDVKLSVLGGDRVELERRGLSRQLICAERVICCPGPWAKEVARIMGYSCPSNPIRRQVCIFDSREVDLSRYGMVVDPSGVYFHPEAQYGLAGYATESEPAGYNFDYEGEEFFNHYIWPHLYERSTGFEKLRHITGWAGLYEVSPDHSGIVGRALHPDPGAGVYEAHSFSGHGVMQSYAAGLELVRMILGRAPETPGVEALSAQRFLVGRAVTERLVI